MASLPLLNPSDCVSTSASKVYSGPLIPPLRAVLTDVTPIERRNMNLWEDEAARAIVVEHAGGYGIGLDYARGMIKSA